MRRRKIRQEVVNTAQYSAVTKKRIGNRSIPAAESLGHPGHARTERAKETQLCAGDPSRVCFAFAILFALQFDAPIGGRYEGETGIQQCAAPSFDPSFC